MEKPRCVAAGLGVSPCLRSLYEWNVYGNGPLRGDWEGWRIAGRDLVAPGGRRVSIGAIEALLRPARSRGGRVVAFRGHSDAETRAMPSGLPTPSDDGGPVAPAIAVLPPSSPGTWLGE